MEDARGVEVAEAAGPLGGDPAALAALPALRGAAAPGYLGHRARLRRRLVEGGPAALLDHELLEVVLFLALPRRDTKPLAQALMRRFGGFAETVAAPAADLAAATELGQAGVAALKAAEAVALRLARAEAAERPLLNTWDRLVEYLTAALARERAERFRVLFLDPRHGLIADEAQGSGGAAGRAPVHPREVVRRALEVGATALVLVRNHQGGDPAPSRADVETAAGVKAAAGAFGIAVHDHLVVGGGRHASLRREGLL